MKVPEIRFEQYKEPFKHVQLGNLTKKSKILNKRGQNKNLLSLSYGKIVRKDIESKKGLLPGSFNSYLEKPRDFDPFGHAGFAHLWLQYD